MCCNCESTIIKRFFMKSEDNPQLWEVSIDSGGGVVFNTEGNTIPRLRLDAAGNLLLAGTLTVLGQTAVTANEASDR